MHFTTFYIFSCLGQLSDLAPPELDSFLHIFPPHAHTKTLLFKKQAEIIFHFQDKTMIVYTENRIQYKVMTTLLIKNYHPGNHFNP